MLGNYNGFLSEMSPRCVHFIHKLKTTDIKTHDINLRKFIIKDCPLPPPLPHPYTHTYMCMHAHAHTHTHVHTHTDLVAGWRQFEVLEIRDRDKMSAELWLKGRQSLSMSHREREIVPDRGTNAQCRQTLPPHCTRRCPKQRQRESGYLRSQHLPGWWAAVWMLSSWRWRSPHQIWSGSRLLCIVPESGSSGISAAKHHTKH